jgi:hypothetical protein
MQCYDGRLSLGTCPNLVCSSLVQGLWLAGMECRHRSWWGISQSAHTSQAADTEV